MRRALVVAMGSEHRRDDGAALEVARHVSRRWPSGPDGTAGDDRVAVMSCHDPLDLLGRWDGVPLAVVLDAMRTGAPAGTVHSLRLDDGPEGLVAGARTASGGRASTHGVDVLDVLRIGRAVGTAPQSVLLVGIEGEDFSRGEGLTPMVRRAVGEAAATVVGLLEEALRCA